MKAKQQHQEDEFHGLRNMIKLLVQRSKPGMRPKEIEALSQNAQHSPIDANNAHGSTHIPNEGEKLEFVKESKNSLENAVTLVNGASKGSKLSYKDRLMNCGFGKLNLYEIIEMVTEDYIFDEDPMEHMEEPQAPFNPNPVIETMEWWINRKWTKKEAVRVMDLVGGYFLVKFSSQEDYSHALFEGPWMITDHYLLIQRYIHKYDGCSEKMKEAKDRQQSQVATEEQNHRKGETPPQSKASQH
ncbi:hypothetical protein Ahy_B03g065740 [Arachis hypogaea]|uniref:DUF4283 domain-containing protein n=1 Tax=Arachis hypogaea TaxID=3818 RepID=A0A445A291_ARAHY|nr:hypothetical protein Ahy_B03g065740 [Arachis hypogaea]